VLHEQVSPSALSSHDVGHPLHVHCPTFHVRPPHAHDPATPVRSACMIVFAVAPVQLTPVGFSEPLMVTPVYVPVSAARKLLHATYCGVVVA
jgi:hypothetical protein